MAIGQFFVSPNPSALTFLWLPVCNLSNCQGLYIRLRKGVFAPNNLIVLCFTVLFRLKFYEALI